MAIVVPIVSTFDNKGVKSASSEIKQAQGGWAKAGAGAKAAFLPAVAVLGGAAVAAKKFTAAAEDTATANARVDQVFKSMGHSQDGLADAAKSYAEALSKQIGVDDEVIKAAQAKLATFSDVADSAELMGRATSAAADLSAAGFGDMASLSNGLGKALQDPIKGMTLLTKQGSLTKAEQEKIAKAFEKTGDKAAAQESILAALEKQVGGVAEATANDSDKMAVAWQDTTSALGTSLLPALKVMTGLFQGLAGWVQENSKVVMILAGVVVGLAAAVVAVNVVMKVWAAAVKIAAAVQWLWNAAMTANPIGLVIVAVVALVAAIVILWKKSDTFRRIVTTAFNAMLKVVKAVWNWIKSNWKTLLAILTGPIGLAITVITRNWDKIKAGAKKVLDWIRTSWKSIKDFLVAPFRAAWDILSGIFDKIMAAVQRVIDLIGRIKIPDVGGFLGKLNPFSSGGDSAARSSLMSEPTPTYQVNIQGAVDPEGTARSLSRLLESHNARQGSVLRTKRAPAW